MFVFCRLLSRELYKSIQKEFNPQPAELEWLIKTQNKEYYELYDNINKFVSLVEQTLILRENGQLVPDSSDEVSEFTKLISKIYRYFSELVERYIVFIFLQLLHHLTDVLYFGSLNPCEMCGTEELIFANSTYVCSHITAWSKCGNDVKEPQRRSTIVHPYLMEKYSFLRTNQPVRVRALHSFRLTDENGTDLVFAYVSVF